MYLKKNKLVFLNRLCRNQQRYANEKKTDFRFYPGLEKEYCGFINYQKVVEQFVIAYFFDSFSGLSSGSLSYTLS